MKKIFCTLLVSSVILGGCVSLKSFAAPPGTDQKITEFKNAQQELKAFFPFYNNLATCTPYNGSILKIYGKSKGSCHVRMADNLGTTYDCHVPMDVADLNSLYGKRTIEKLSKIDLEETFSDENIKDINALTDFAETMRGITQDLQKLQQVESTLMQYNCKPEL